jgi:excisionase family DNA binding protein
MISVKEAARRAGVNVSYIRAEIAAGRLRAEKPGTEWIISERAFAAWLRNPRRGTRSARRGTGNEEG